MKRFFTPFIFLILTVSICHNASAQGVFQLWGTTAYGGPSGTGTMFSLNAYGNKFRNRYNFTAQNEGYGPYTKLAAFNGKFYGTTEFGGINGHGVIFEWNPVTNIFTKKFDFSDDNGRSPGALLLKDGKFYGTAQGGNTILTIIFEWDPVTNIYTKKVEVTGADGLSPSKTLTLKDGKIYGTTAFGGANTNGVIFEWDPATNIYTKKYDFNGTDGASANGGMALWNNKFYGLTSGGGSEGRGVIYEWDPATNIYTKKRDFSLADNNGYNPVGTLSLYNNRFYGMTPRGGNSDEGVIFGWDPAINLYSKRFNFSTATGTKPFGDLELITDKFYGLTSEGGAFSGGIIFEWDPTQTFITKKIDMTIAGGANSQGSMLASAGKLYGMTRYGGVEYDGTLFEWNLSGNIYTKKIDLYLNDGLFPTQRLTSKNGMFYGVTSGGGAGQRGTVYEWNPATSQITKQTDLGTVNGAVPAMNDENTITGTYPNTRLVEKNGKYYGLTMKGGTSSQGAIFEWDAVSNIYTKKIDLPIPPSTPASYLLTLPIGNLIPYNNKFVGIFANNGNQNFLGYIFEWDPATNIYTPKFDFTIAGGAIPYPDLLEFNGKFYGTTYRGGANDEGVIFEWDPVTNNYTKKIEFAAGVNGSRPLAGLTLMSNNKMYGSTFLGGTNNEGVLFEWDPSTNTYTKQFDLTIATGGKPFGTMANIGPRLFGLAGDGGSNDRGVAFEWRPHGDSFIVNHHFNFTDGSFIFEEELIGFNELAVVPAPVAKGIANSCSPLYTSERIHTPTYFAWVPLTDDNGDVIAEINANGNTLGDVNFRIYINDGPVREDGHQHLYLDRNFVITPEFQPVTPVSVRLYITEEEFQALKNATNTLGQPSGISTINDLGLFKSAGSSCTDGLQVGAVQVPVTVQPYGNGYVITASISSFSNFYFASKALAVLPLTLLEINGKTSGNDAVLDWKTVNEINTSLFIVERSVNGKDFTAVGSIFALNSSTEQRYNFTDKDISSLPSSALYYRLRQTDMDGKAVYSKVVRLAIGTKGPVAMIYPNPATKDLSLLINIQRAQKLKWTIADNNGMVVRQGDLRVSAGSSNTSITIETLSRGVYYLNINGDVISERIKFVKQ